MLPLIDGDVIRYEIGFAAETGWKTITNGENENPPSFDYVAELLDMRIQNICACVGATRKPIIFLSGEGNFREEIAKRKKYKERASHKPFHFHNITAYLLGNYNCIVSKGVEADDVMAMEQSSHNQLFKEGVVDFETIICTRDKDLRQVEGWHFSWELGNQPQIGPEKVDALGYLTLEKRSYGNVLKGCGAKFFYAQMLIGDSVDTVPGLKGCGPVKAFKILNECPDIPSCEKAVIEAYKGVYGDAWKEEMLEQGQLLYMVRSLDENGQPIMWRMDDA